MTQRNIDKYRLMRKLGSQEPRNPELAKYKCANCKYLPASGTGICKDSLSERSLPFNIEADLKINIFCFYFEERK